jgi:hypothetical protein
MRPSAAGNRGRCAVIRRGAGQQADGTFIVPVIGLSHRLVPGGAQWIGWGSAAEDVGPEMHSTDAREA